MYYISFLPIQRKSFRCYSNANPTSLFPSPSPDFSSYFLPLSFWGKGDFSVLKTGSWDVPGLYSHCFTTTIVILQLLEIVSENTEMVRISDIHGCCKFKNHHIRKDDIHPLSQRHMNTGNLSGKPEIQIIISITDFNSAVINSGVMLGRFLNDVHSCPRVSMLLALLQYHSHWVCLS